MSDAEIKLKLFRLIDTLPEYNLKDIYDLLRAKLETFNKSGTNNLSDLDSRYKQMAEDRDREKEAIE